MIDPSEIGQLTMKVIEHVETEFGPEAELRNALVVVEVAFIDDEGDKAITYKWDSIVKSPAYSMGILDGVHKSIRQGFS